MEGTGIVPRVRAILTHCILYEHGGGYNKQYLGNHSQTKEHVSYNQESIRWRNFLTWKMSENRAAIINKEQEEHGIPK